MEENKEKKQIKISLGTFTAGLIAIILLVLAILMGIYLLSQSSNRSINPELADMVMLAKKGTKLVANSSSGEEIIIYDFAGLEIEIDSKGTKLIMEEPFNPGLDENFKFDYDKTNNTIYLFLFGKDKKRAIASIDLTEGNGNYHIKIISKVDVRIDWWGPDYIAKANNYIYFSLDKLYRYDMKNNKIEDLNINSSKHVLKVLPYKQGIVYNVNEDTYVLNIETNKSKKILTNYYFDNKGYIYDNLLICVCYDENIGEYYYTYNFDNGEINKISHSEIIPFNNKFYSCDEDVIYESNGKETKEFYKFSFEDLKNMSPNLVKYDFLYMSTSITKTSEDSVYIDICGGWDDDYVTVNTGVSVLFNLSTKKFILKDNAYEGDTLYGEYREVLYLK